jgi:penicillin amidase
VYLAAAWAMGRAMLTWLQDGSGVRTTSPLLAALEAWNGHYDAASQGALAFELLLFHLARALVPARRRDIYAAAWSLRGLVWADITAAAPAARSDALRRAFAAAAKDFGRGRPWGGVHRVRLGSLLGAAPGLARLYRLSDLPASGTSETVMKTAHAPARRRHGAAYGSVARHVSDMSDPDANYFALLGGQDGWMGSAAFADQIALWNAGEYVTLPLDPARARANAAQTITLTP